MDLNKASGRSSGRRSLPVFSGGQLKIYCKRGFCLRLCVCVICGTMLYCTVQLDLGDSPPSQKNQKGTVNK